MRKPGLINFIKTSVATTYLELSALVYDQCKPRQILCINVYWHIINDVAMKCYTKKYVEMEMIHNMSHL